MKFKKGAKIETSDFYYDLFQGGYIKPSKVLKSKLDVELIEHAIKVIKHFEEEAEKQGVLELQ